VWNKQRDTSHVHVSFSLHRNYITEILRNLNLLNVNTDHTVMIISTPRSSIHYNHKKLLVQCNRLDAYSMHIIPWSNPVFQPVSCILLWSREPDPWYAYIHILFILPIILKFIYNHFQRNCSNIRDSIKFSSNCDSFLHLRALAGNIMHPKL
jgi:hypothetical protein